MSDAGACATLVIFLFIAIAIWVLLRSNFKNPYPDDWDVVVEKIANRQKVVLGLSGMEIPERSKYEVQKIEQKRRQFLGAKFSSGEYEFPAIVSGGSHIAPLSIVGITSRSELSLVDIVVEKAQEALLYRRHNYVLLANIFAIVFIIIAGALIAELKWKFILCGGVLSPSTGCAHPWFLDSAMNWQEVTVRIFAKGAIVGVFLAGLYMVVSLLRAFLHEATILENRIHSIRLGRLYLYMKYFNADVDELEEFRKSLTPEDIQNAFGWNIETSTAFKDIDAREVNKSVIGQVSAAIVAAFSRSRANGPSS